MSVSLDTKFEKGFTGSSPKSYVSNAGTVAGTVGSGLSNPVLVMACAFKFTNTGGFDPSSVAMTWNGVGGTPIGNFTIVMTSSKSHAIYLFYLKNPATGDQTISLTWTAGGGSDSVVVAAWSLYNVDQSTVFQNVTTNTATGTNETITVTSANGNMVLTFHTDDNAAAPFTPTAGTLTWSELTLGGNFESMHQASSSGSTTTTATIGSSKIWGILGVDMIADSNTTAFVAPTTQLSSGGKMIGLRYV